MRGVFPGKPQSALHAVDTVVWSGLRIVAYVSGNNLNILRNPHDLFQSITLDDSAVLQSVALDSLSGKIAVTDSKQVFIYQPIGQEYGALRWSLQHTYNPDQAALPITCLSWGLPGELLVASSHLVLLSTDRALNPIWRSGQLANPAKAALFSHDASLIASCGHHDRLVKVWRRGFIGGGNERFDPVYIGHPAAVTSMRWRKRRPHQEGTDDENADPVLYTACTDGKLRVWAAHDPHYLQVLRLWAEIDMFTAIQPREPLSPGAGQKRRFATVLDHWAFESAVSVASATPAHDERKHHTRRHLQELADLSPEVIIIFDDQGNMSAWGLERVACKARQRNDVLNLTNVEGLGLELLKNLSPAEAFASLHAFNVGSDVHLLTHYFDGRLQWSTAPVDRLLDVSPDSKALQLQSELTGHADSVKYLRSSGTLTASFSHVGEIIVWRREALTISRQSYGNLSEPVLDLALDATHNLVLLLTSRRLVLFSADASQLEEIAGCNVDHNIRKASNASLSPIDSLDDSNLHVAVASSQADKIYLDVFHASLARTKQVVKCIRSTISRSEDINGFTNGASAGQPSVAEHLRFASSHETLTCFTHKGYFETYRCTNTEPNGDLRLQISTSYLLPNAKSAAMSALSSYVALTNASALTLCIVNTSTGGVEFYKNDYEAHDPIQCLRWCQVDKQSSCALAVVFAHKVSILCPQTIDSTASPLWIPLFDVSMSERSSNPISDACWISASSLLIAAGSQMFAESIEPTIQSPSTHASRSTKISEKKVKLPRAVEIHNPSRPLFHPMSWIAILQSGETELFFGILRQLNNQMKFFTEGDELSSSLSRRLSDIRSVDSTYASSIDDESTTLTPDEATMLTERVEQIPWLSSDEQREVRHLVQTATKIAVQQNSIDTFATQYLSALFLNKATLQDELSFMAIFHAAQTTSHDLLVSEISSQHSNLTWTTARQTGLFLWLPDPTSVRTHLETVARAEYTKTKSRDPVDCALFYLALRKKPVLTNLWRMATWHKEQRSTHRMLQNDFADARWRTAAAKNAYALLGKRRYEYAAAWFLLADDLHGAVGVLASQCDDIRLAIAVARAYEGDNGPVLTALLHEKILPRAAADNDRWIAAWAFWMLGRKRDMLRAFIDPWTSLLPSPPTSIPAFHPFRSSDPVLAANYQRTREAIASDPRATKEAAGLSVRNEHALVLRCAHTYMRMGLGMLAIDLLRRFRFSTHSGPRAQVPAEVEEVVEPSALDAFFADDSPAEEAPVLKTSLGKQEGKGGAPSALDAFLDDSSSGSTSQLPTRSAAQAGETPSALDAFFDDPAPASSTSTPARAQTGAKAEKKQAAAPSERSILDDFDF